jgi:tetratricopeptide (TPR) repeat protein
MKKNAKLWAVNIISFLHRGLRPNMSGCVKKKLKFICLGGLMLCLIVGSTETGCSKKIGETGSDPGNIGPCDDEADRAMHQQDYQSGILLHERLLEKDPGNALASFHLGYAYGQIGDHRKEVFYYEKAIASGFSTDRIYFNLGMAYGELSEIEKSIAAFKKALEINPESSNSHFGLALAYYQNGFADDLTEGEFLKAVDIDPTNLDARLYLNIFYVERGKIQKASHQLREILKIDPTNTRARELLEKIEKK